VWVPCLEEALARPRHVKREARELARYRGRDLRGLRPLLAAADRVTVRLPADGDVALVGADILVSQGQGTLT
jgi:hypothetical protein